MIAARSFGILALAFVAICWAVPTLSPGWFEVYWENVSGLWTFPGP